MARDLFHFFKGEWTFRRTIRDTRSGHSTAVASGNAVFSEEQQAATLHYRENGRVILQETMEAHSFFRDYRYCFRLEKMDVYFADIVTGNNGLYQSYRYHAETGLLQATEMHTCNKDLYTGVYKIESDDLFSNNITVLGPQKDYTSVTVYTRLAGDP